MADAAPATCDPARITSWQDLRFGLFLHWGLYSLTAGYWQGRRALSSGHIMLHERIPVETWGRLAADFVPTRFDANAWVAAALAAGMKYLVITTKHHDGLAMFDSPSSGYDIVHLSPWGVDPMAEIARACHAQGLRLGFYYSLGRDWQDPDVPTDWPEKGGRSNTWDYPDEDAKDFSRYFARKVKPQITELLTRYGRVDMLWFDTPEKISREQSTELLDLIRSLQPECLVNDRIGSELGDYATREQKIGAVQNDRPWESCVTMARHWNYDRDELPYYKPADLLIHQLVETVSKGGNYLLNIGPTPEGTLPDAALARLAAIGRWCATWPWGWPRISRRSRMAKPWMCPIGVTRRLIERGVAMPAAHIRHRPDVRPSIEACG